MESLGDNLESIPKNKIDPNEDIDALQIDKLGKVGNKPESKPYFKCYR